MKKYLIFYGISMALPLCGADQNSDTVKSAQHLDWLSDTDWENLCREARKTYAEKHPITMAIIKTELQRTPAAIMREQAKAAEHITWDKHEVLHERQILSFKTAFNDTMPGVLAQHIVALVQQKELQKKVIYLGQGELDDFTKYETNVTYDVRTESSVRFVHCTTTIFRMSDLEKFLTEAEKGN